MESRIKIKATASEMRTFFDVDGGVRYMEIQDKRYTKEALEAMLEDEYNRERFTFFVIYRHKELEKHLTGTFSIAGLKKRLNEKELPI